MQFYFSTLQKDNAKLRMGLVMAVANSFMSLQHYESALKYYLMLEGCASNNVCISAKCFRLLDSSNVVGLEIGLSSCAWSWRVGVLIIDCTALYCVLEFVVPHLSLCLASCDCYIRPFTFFFSRVVDVLFVIMAMPYLFYMVSFVLGELKCIHVCCPLD